VMKAVAEPVARLYLDSFSPPLSSARTRVRGSVTFDIPYTVGRRDQPSSDFSSASSPMSPISD